MKKNYIAPVVEIELFDENLMLCTSPLTDIKVGDPVGDGEEVTADVKGNTLWDNEW